MTRPNPYPIRTWIVWAAGLPLAIAVAGVLALLMSDVQRIPFDSLDLWWTLLTIPLTCTLLVYGAIRRRRSLERFVSPMLAPLLVSRVQPHRQVARAALIGVAVCALVAAILGPRWGMYLEERRAIGVDIVVLLDVSKSMLAEDLEPNRLEASKRAIRQQLTERSSAMRDNRLALIAFAGSASMKVPLTLDHAFFRDALNELNTGSVPRGGTAIAEAIYTAADCFASSPEDATKIILLFTDGEDHEGDPVEAAGQVNDEYNIRVVPVGVGDPASTVGAQVPAGPGQKKPLLYNGQIVFSRLEMGQLEKIAEAGGGTRATVLNQLPQVVNALVSERKTHLTTEERQRYRPRYQWFLAVALACLTAESLLGWRRGRDAAVAERVWQQEGRAA